jgi:hypothetical protein
VFATASNPRTGEIRDAIAESKSQRQIPNPKSKIPNPKFPLPFFHATRHFGKLFSARFSRSGKSGKENRRNLEKSASRDLCGRWSSGQLIKLPYVAPARRDPGDVDVAVESQTEDHARINTAGRNSTSARIRVIRGSLFFISATHGSAQTTNDPEQKDLKKNTNLH